MNSTTELPAWRILPAPGDHFIWSPTDGDSRSQFAHPRKVLISDGEPRNLPTTLPSGLLPASTKLREGGGGDEDGVPMFKTGSGRSVTVRQSSLRKAEMVLRESDKSGGCGGLCQGVSGEGGLPMFCTGSGKLVKVSKSSLEKAASVLKLDMPEQGYGVLSEGDAADDGLLLFSTGSGSSVQAKKASLKMETFVLKGDMTERENMLGGEISAPLFQTGLGRPVGLKQSSIRKALSVLQEEENVEMGTMQKCNPRVGVSVSGCSLWRDSGKVINISAGGFRRANALLGLDENHIPLTESVTDQTSFDTGNRRKTSGMSFFNPLGDEPVERRSFISHGNENVSRNQIESSGPGKLHVSSMHASAPISPPIMFHTAGGRSLPISDDALRRARSLLGDQDTEILQNGISTSYLIPSVSNDNLHEMSQNKENFDFIGSNSERSRNMFKIPMQESSLTFASLTADFAHGNKVNNDAFSSERIHEFDGKMLHVQNMPRKDLHETFKVENLRMGPEGRPPRPPLANISNKASAGIPIQVDFSGDNRRQRRTSSISPFKRPRSSRFSTPLRENTFLIDTGQSLSSSAKDCCQKLKLENLSDQVKHINLEKAATYKFKISSDSEAIGTDELKHLLIQSGASSLKATKECTENIIFKMTKSHEGMKFVYHFGRWVQNHYKWIVWKLACLERGYPEQAKGKYLTAANVLEELKYRYEREVNHGHRSAVKRILDGDASPASMMVLCVSDIHHLSSNSTCDGQQTSKHEDADKSKSCNRPINCDAVKIELTDGCSFIEVRNYIDDINTIKIRFVNRLANRLGFRFPLAFRCIKGAGGQIPKTLVGVTRIYPILYKERFPDGGSIVRSERMESKMVHLHNQRRLLVAEDIMSKQDKFFSENDNDSEEGAKILKILETSAEPEVLMASMSSEQLISVSNYQAKQEAIKQNNIVKTIEKALEDAGLSSREVTPFMRVRVVELNQKGSSTKGSLVQGLIAIWNPTEQQKADLVEGQMYSVSGLTPLNGVSDILHLQARGPTSRWKPLSPTASDKFE
ncbi:unnamed protein product [Spirodela intermedia]|uniref:Tower domain-containing protein n=1 Tax=Spirodela intermedia TaxID=51605 RepID=A0A7I8IAK0_SPIIN|nr:unnamed protein product [Spirodela intermedia]CAA6654699.1 unnamed protein product [Spirodela intermedia]